MKALITFIILFSTLSALSLGLITVAQADPPGQEPCGHGNSNKPCREDPQPDHGKDCEAHGNGGRNEDHCSPTQNTSTPTSTPTEGPTSTPTSIPPTNTSTATITATIGMPATQSPSSTPTPTATSPTGTVILVAPQIVLVSPPVIVQQPAIQRQPAPPVVADVAPARTPAFSPPRSGDGGLVGQTP